MRDMYEDYYILLFVSRYCYKHLNISRIFYSEDTITVTTFKTIFKRLYTCQLSRLRRESHACELKTSISRLLTQAGQFLTPDCKMRVVAVLLDTISKNMLTKTHVRNENHV